LNDPSSLEVGEPPDELRLTGVRCANPFDAQVSTCVTETLHPSAKGAKTPIVA
jgi:hypothetical protein